MICRARRKTARTAAASGAAAVCECVSRDVPNTRVAPPRSRQRPDCSVAAGKEEEEHQGAGGGRWLFFRDLLSGFNCTLHLKVQVPNPVYLHRPPARSPLMLCCLSFLFLRLFSVCVLLSRISEAACSYYVRPACTIVPLQQIQEIQKVRRKTFRSLITFGRTCSGSLFESA